MDFLFNGEQTSLGETIGQVLGNFPALTGPDPVRDSDNAVWAALGELGLFALLVPEDLGGVGLPLLDCALAIQALGAGLAPPLVAATLAATEVLNRCASPGQKAAWLPRVARGELSLALAIADAGGASDPAEPHCRVADGRLSGVKVAVAGGTAAGAFLVTARQDARPVLVVIEADAPGVTVREHDSLDPSAGLCELTFANVDVATGAIETAETSAAIDQLIDLAAAVDAGVAIGIARRMLEVSVEYARTRVQFGQPIGAFQAIKHRCADLAVAVEAGQVTSDYAIWACTADPAEQSRRASAAKAYCSEIARDACNDAIQIHGGMGFTWDLALHRYLRRAKVIEYASGGRSWHYDRVLRETLAAHAAMPEPRRDAA